MRELRLLRCVGMAGKTSINVSPLRAMLAGVESNLRSDQAVASNAAYIQLRLHVTATREEITRRRSCTYFPANKSTVLR